MLILIGTIIFPINLVQLRLFQELLVKKIARKMKTFILVLSLFALGQSVIQEIVLHESLNDYEGNSYVFRRGVPDTSIYPFIGDIVRFCHNSRMSLYPVINYEGNSTYQQATSGCHDFNSTAYKSFRFFGHSNTSVDIVSLFPEDDLRGEEIRVDHSPFGHITQNIRSVAYSGSAGWTLFEEDNFWGNTTCLPAGNSSNTIAYTKLTSLNITNVGSLVKGCTTTVTPQMRAALRRLTARTVV